MAIPYVIHRNPPSSVVYDLTQANQATITLPAGSTWTSGLHWHETHTEYLRVVQGRVRVRLGSKVRILSAADGEVEVGRNVWHEWSRAVPDGEEVVVVERTDPADGEKAIFFWNLNAVILSAQEIGRPSLVPGWLFGMLMEVWVSINLFAIFDGLDNFPVFLGIGDTLSRRGLRIEERTILWHIVAALERAWCHLVLGVATRLGWFLGIRAVRQQYTPAEEYRQWINRGRRWKMR